LARTARANKTTVLGEPRGPATELRMTPEQTVAPSWKLDLECERLWRFRPITMAQCLSASEWPSFSTIQKYVIAIRVSGLCVCSGKRAGKRTFPTWMYRAICILDPDGDIVRRLRMDGRATPFEAGRVIIRNWMRSNSPGSRQHCRLRRRRTIRGP
jgi:hypothetical protein